MKLIPARLKALSGLTSTDEKRRQMTGVYVNPLDDKRVQFTVTDGHQLLQVTQLEGSQDPAEFPSIAGFSNGHPETAAILPASAWAGMFKDIPKPSRCKGLPILQHVAYTTGEGEATVATTDLEQGNVKTLKTIDGHFPNAAAVLPTEPGTVTIHFDVNLLARVFSTLSQLLPAEHKKQAEIRIDIYGPEQAMRVTALDKDNHLYYAGAVMPMRGGSIPLTAPGPITEEPRVEEETPVVAGDEQGSEGEE